MATQRKPKPQDNPKDATEGIWILVSHHRNGATYELSPVSLDRIKDTFSDIHLAPTVFIGYETKSDFQKIHGPMFKQIAKLLCGVSAQRLKAHGLGEVHFLDLNTREINLLNAGSDDQASE